MNKNDSERLAGLLESSGMMQSHSEETSDFLIFNSCSIRDKAERRIYGQIRKYAHLRKTTGRPQKLILTGCMPQYTGQNLLKELPEIDYITGCNNYENMITHIKEGTTGAEQIKAIRPSRNETYVKDFEHVLSNQKRESPQDAWVSIMFGCDNFCSYCIVPYTRGREISRSKEDVFEEIKNLTKAGYKKIILLGQNVNSYGKKRYDNYFFPELLEDIAHNFKTLNDIRFMTSHPYDVKEKLIDVMAAHPNIKNEIHFPIQHGDNEILKRMNRKYTVEDYLQKVDMIRKKIPSVRIGTDIITGFPGETETHFQNMLKTLKKVDFDFANTAAYSPRKGTRAAAFKDQIPEEEKKHRLNRLNQFFKELHKTRTQTKCLTT